MAGSDSEESIGQDMSGHSTAWWDEVDLSIGQTGCWSIGPLTLWARRMEHEWQVGHERGEDPAEDLGGWSFSVSEAPLAEDIALQRFVFQRTPGKVQPRPALADRPMVVRPAKPFFVPAGEQANVYVSSPLWLSIHVGAAPVKLQEVAVQRPSDTWFGASTREGALCYASRTSARLRLQDLPVRAYRATTRVLVRNESAEPMLLERLSLPVANLALYSTPDGVLWTQPVTMTREKDGDMAAIELGGAPPSEAKRAKQVAEPRQRPERRVVVRALSALFG